ncbi:hypothetical protein ERJ75_000890400 [Trypanosoma vivax]|nr:hypothetical protein ERJ75_000890400 [Trypanosoma vivax]
MPDKRLCTRCTGTQQDAPLEGVHPLEQVPTAKDSHDLFDAFAVADGGEYWMGGDVLAADLAAASASGFQPNGCSAPIPDRTSCMLNQDRVSPKPVSSDKYYPYYFDAIFSSTPHSGRGNECGTIDGSQLGFWLLYSPPSSAGVRPGSERSRSSDLFHDQKSLGLTTTVAETARPRRRTLALQPDPLCQKSTAIPNGEKRRWPGHRLLSLEASRDSLVGVLGGCPTPTEAQSYMEGMSFILTLLCARGNSDHADGVIHSKLLSRKNADGTVIAPDATTAMPSDVSPASERDGCCGMSPVDTRSAGATQGCGISPLGASCSCQEGLRPYDMKGGSSHTECPCPCGKALHSPFPRPGMRMETEGPGTPTLHCAGLRELKGGLPPLQGSEVRHHACPRRLAGHVVVDNGLANGAEVTRTSSAPFPSVEAVTDGEIGAPSSIEGVCASRRKECALAAHAADAEVRANGSTFATGDTPVAMGVDGNKVLGTRRVSELWHAGNEHSSVGAGNVLAGEMQVSPVGAVLRCPTPQEVSFPTERILQRKQEDCRADSACGGATEMVHARGREAEGRTESADKTPDPSRVPSGWEASATTNRVRMLVLNDKTSENRSSPAERMSLRTDTTLEITRGREQACLFRVDEYLECAGSDKLYSVTLAELRRKFLSGVNVAVLVSGSESALPVGWRAVREVVWCIFRDVGDGCELFASAALVQHGLTQDLLSGCGRMTRTAVVSVPPLQPMLENVDYVKLSDARHFSSLLVRSLESACLGEAHAHGYIAVSVLLKQAKEGDVVLSSMLVVGGANSTNSPSEALWKDDSALQHLFGAAVGGSCFTVSVVSLSEHDDGLAQLMNSQREVPSFVNQACVVGSMKQLIEKAKGEIAGCCDKDRHHPEKVSSLLEQVAFAESLIADPKGFIAKCGVKGLQGCYAKMSKEEHGARGRSATQREFSAKLVAESRACDSARGNPSFWQQRAEVGSGEWQEEQCIYSNGGAGAESTAMQLCTDDPESSTDKRTAVPVGGTADKPSVKHTTTISGRISEARSKGCLTHIAARCDTPPTTNGGGLPPITRPINANRAPPPHTSRCRSGQKPFSVPSSRTCYPQWASARLWGGVVKKPRPTLSRTLCRLAMRLMPKESVAAPRRAKCQLPTLTRQRRN